MNRWLYVTDKAARWSKYGMGATSALEPWFLSAERIMAWRFLSAERKLRSMVFTIPSY
jgi:hypothetical protein